MQIGPTRIEATHAEAFGAAYARLVLTAADTHWLHAATSALCGYGTSVIGCDAEVGVERMLDPKETPDGRPGTAVLAFTFRREQLAQAVANRVGQAVLTCPTAALFDGLPDAENRLPLGDYLRYFGDGHEQHEADQWRIPLMEGDLLLPATVGTARGLAGGNLIVQGIDQPTALAAARRASEAIAPLTGVITPFPGGVCRSGSKVGSRYQKLIASTNEAFCPTLDSKHAHRLADGATSVYELVINGTDEQAVRLAMREALHAVAGDGVLLITAGNYDGQLGRTLIPLQELLG